MTTPSPSSKRATANTSLNKESTNSTANDSAFIPGYVPHSVVRAAIAITLAASVYSGWVSGQLPDFAAWSSTLALVISLGAAFFITPRAFVPGFLISILPFLIAWRVAAMNGVTVMEWVAPVAFLPLVAQFFEYVREDWKRAKRDGIQSAAVLLWQMTTVRMVFGLNELGHATEKLFAGKASFHNLVHGFHGFGIGHAAALMVILGGLTELASAISVGLGLLSRLGALLSIGYFLVATVGFGGEWTRGYAWASAGGGGWEYMMLLLTVFGAVLIGGAGKFSLDAWLLHRGWIPKRLRCLCSVSTAKHT